MKPCMQGLAANVVWHNFMQATTVKDSSKLEMNEGTGMEERGEGGD